MRTTMILGLGFLLAACGGSPNGKLTGKVSVTGGALSAGNITVEAVGPNGGGALTDSSGNYEIDALADGNYAVSAVLTGSTEGEVRVFATVKGGKGTAPELKFTAPAAAPGPGTVTGKVAFSDGSDASSITVTLTGPASQGLSAMADGTFTFSGVTPGFYTLSADATDTLEHRVAVAVQVTGSMTTTAPNLTLTAVGTVTGKAVKSSNATGNAGITVSVAGSGARATTADDGSYTLHDVPTGMQTLIASLTDYDPATAMVAVTRGSTSAMDLSISKLTVHGTVVGSVSFADQQDRSIITVKAAGTLLAVSCDSNGHYSLPLPAGHFDLVADAPFFPTHHLGQVAVDDGTQVTLPDLTMSPWIDLPVEAGVVASPTLSPTLDGDHALYVLPTVTGFQYRMLDLRAGVSHPFFVGSSIPMVTSAHGKYAAAYGAGEWLILETGTAALQALLVNGPATGNISTFTSDEKFFIVGDGVKIHRLELATGIDTPITAVKGVDYLNDSFLVQDVAMPPFTLSYAGATGAPVSAAIGVTKYLTFVSGQTVVWNNCSGSCALHLIDQASGMVANPSGAFASSLNATTAVGSPAWIDFSGTGAGFLNVASLNFTVKPVNLGGYAFNPSGSAVLYEIVGMPFALHYEAGAPSGAGTTIGTSGSSFAVGTAGTTAWLDDTRALAFGGSPVARYDIVNGTPTTDSDVVPGSALVVPPVARWVRASDQKELYADRELADLAVDQSAMPFPEGFCETLDGKSLMVSWYAPVGPALTTVLVRNNSTGALTTLSGLVLGEIGRCSGKTSSDGVNIGLNTDEWIVATGQTIDFGLNHVTTGPVKSASLGVTQEFGVQQTGSSTIEFPSLMLIP